MLIRILALMTLSGSMLAAVVDVRPTRLRCEYLDNPVGIDVAWPRFSWQMEDGGQARGRKQTAYRVLVASTRGKLDADQADLWDSGMVSSNQSHLVSYAGQALDSHRICYWKVRLWTDEGVATPWSPVARYTMGMLKESDWQGPWITCGNDPETGKPIPVTKHLWFRRDLELEGIPASAIIHVASIGYHELHVNGVKADDRVLAPTLTRLDKRVHYVSYDIARFLKAGTNTIAIHYGPGWSRYDFFKTSPAIRLQLHGEMADGRLIELASDSRWLCRVAASENTGKCQWGNNGGESIDVRRDRPGWDLPGHDSSAWARAIETKKQVVLSADRIPPSRVIATIPTVSIKLADKADKAADGTSVHEVLLERNFTGFLRIRMRGQESGDRIVITVADSPKPGSVFNQISEYVCSGEDEEVFQNRFNYCAGRYLSIKGLRQEPRPADIVGLAVSNALEPTASFTCSNELFNRIYQTDVWTFLANTTEGFTADCPHRERMGYGEVAFATCWGIGLPNFDSGAYYANMVRNWADVQEENGWIHHTAPQINRHYGGAMWSSAGLNVAAETYLHHGDLRVLEANHESAKRWLEFLNQHVEDGLLCSYNEHWGKFLGDWAAPGPNVDGKSFAGRDERGDSPAAKYFNNCVYAKNLADFIHHSRVLGKLEGLGDHEQRLGRLRSRIHREFHHADTQTYCDGTQVQQAFALLAGVCPPELRDKLRSNLVESIRRCGYLDMGSSGLPVLLKTMIELSGEAEVLAGPLDRTEVPGYGAFIKGGQSTWPEYWTPRESNIHTCYTGIASWFIKSIGGIRPDPEHPGYQQFLISPVVPAGLAHARASIQSPYGTIVSEWRRENQHLILDLRIPPNCSATVHVPTGDPQAMRDKVSGMDGVGFLRVGPGHAILRLDAGSYRLEASLP